ncbi:MAG: 30S ribosomal protein S5 [Candidatus Nanoarchaeia archaeon]
MVEQQRQQGRGGDRRPRRGDDRRQERRPRREQEVVEKVWTPKTQVGKDVLAGKYTDIKDVIRSGHKILESEITDHLVPDLTTEFVNTGQAKGKFGGGKRKPPKATQKVTKEGSVMSFSMVCLSGDKNGVVGLGFGKARENVPAREKAIKKAKQNLILIRRGSGSWGSFGSDPTTIPFSVEGKCGSVKVKLIPAPKGTGLVAEKEVAKMCELAGIKDVWSKTFGTTSNKINLMSAAFEALKELQKVRLTPEVIKNRNIIEGDKLEFEELN